MLIEIPVRDILPSDRQCQSPDRQARLESRLAKQPASPEKYSLRLSAASAKRQRLIQATKEAAVSHNRHAKEVAATTKEQRAVATAHMRAALTARLDAAAERRKANSRGGSPLASPLGSAKDVVASLMPEGEKFSLPPAAGAPAVSPSKESTANLPELAVDSGMELLNQLNALRGEDEQAQEWMKLPSTIDLAARWLDECGIDTKFAKKLLALVYMALSPEGLFDSSAEDKIMQREVRRFNKQLRLALKGPDASHFEAAFTRVRRYQAAWASQDVPKQAREVDLVLARLNEALMAIRAQQVQQGGEPNPPEDLLAQMRLLGGADVEEAARRQFGQPWQAVAPADLEARVRDVATRAFWDAITAQVGGGDYSGLFGVLRELQKSMGALLAHSAARRDELDDKFDAGWIESQATNGALTTEQVQGLIQYVARQIGSWQAPADEAATAAWEGAVNEMCHRTRGMDLTPFIAQFLVPFLRGAIDRVGQVYQRLMALAPQEEVAAAAADAMAADAMAEQD